MQSRKGSKTASAVSWRTPPLTQATQPDRTEQASVRKTFPARGRAVAVCREDCAVDERCNQILGNDRRLQDQRPARRQRRAAAVPAWCTRRRRVAAVLQGAVRAFRGDRARASGLRPLRGTGMARQCRRPRQFLSRVHAQARLARREPGRHVARRLDRRRLGGAQLRPPAHPDPRRRRRHPRAGRAQGRPVPVGARAARAQPVLRSDLSRQYAEADAGRG